MSAAVYDILLVDDEAKILLIVGDLLRIHGFSVITAPDGTTGLKHLEAHQIGLVILDLNLAGEDGLGWLDYYRKKFPHVPVILYTGLIHDPRQVAIMLQSGAASYVNKSQPIEALLSAIHQARDLRGGED